ncbi:MAG: 30S ribosomal protein S20 [Acidobacteria bacterium]|nr:30S ribosomal protein S20 [Acidobacteriota bacterium]
MANHPSALKAHRQSQRRRDRNRSSRSELRTELKLFRGLLAEGRREEAAKSLSSLYSKIDRAVRKGALRKNAAARHKSRFTKKLNTTAEPAAS